MTPDDSSRSSPSGPVVVRTTQLRGNSSNKADPYNPTGSLYRKSLSLEQNVSMPDETVSKQD